MKYAYVLVCVFFLSTAWVAGQDLPDDPQQALVSQANANQPYIGITAKQRVKWAVKGTIGPTSLAAGLFTAGFGTAQNSPEEYGPHWDGFGKRYGVRLSAVGTEHVMEAGIGALWHEDPRYFRSEDRTLSGRLGHIVTMTFEARREDGHLAPAYARLVSMPAANFISNTWRPDSEANTNDAIRRTALSFVGRMAGNAFAEFWPDVRTHLFHKKK